MIRPRPWLDRITPYRPGRQALTAAGSMASNESPIGASPRVTAAVAKAMTGAHHYPDPLATDLRQRLAELHEVSVEHILVGNGSDELIFLLAWAYLAHGGQVVCADPAYRVDEISSQVVDARLTKIPLRNWTHDLQAMADVAADIAYVVNPHNPTGTTLGRQEIESFVARAQSRLVVIDEAYIDFTDDPAATSAIPLARQGKAAVLRTFSKVYGLAGLRIGYLVADPAIIHTLRTVRAPFSVGGLAQAAALAALEDHTHYQAVRRHTVQHRAALTGLFTSAGYDVVPSQANFVLVRTEDEDHLVARLAEHGVSVRPGSALGAPGTVRISVPSRPGMALVEQALATA
ncbi:histidinol-phosphate transaminase [Streptomyces sp. NPDC056938]|uniref:histidinol-phosphate transaminase n=1 Tax=unclassified Streptomyces TaxID=2593676 RepID=UPI003631C191